MLSEGVCNALQSIHFAETLQTTDTKQTFVIGNGKSEGRRKDNVKRHVIRGLRVISGVDIMADRHVIQE
jgi:hypothetical protein